MPPYSIEEITRRIAPVAEKYQLPAVYLFGSYARGDATADSDVDLLVDVSGTGLRGLDFGGLYNDFQEALGLNIDLITTASLARPTDRRGQQSFRDAVNRERKMIYAVS